MQKKDLHKRFTPERCGMICSPECNGRGKIPKNTKEFEVCIGCGGFGLIKASRREQLDGHPFSCPTFRSRTDPFAHSNIRILYD
jgi:hypothetical protein